MKSGESLEALAQKRESLFKQGLGYFATTKKWWMALVVFMLLILALLFSLSGSVAAPFIYTLF
jgi:hypothetical protein